jgi:U3 small nucleolar ribonucleoprotein protein LCP5
VLTDLAESASGAANPYAEPSTGLAAAPSLGHRRERELAEMDTYEESNMTRLFQTKKAAKRRREDEARQQGAAPRAGFADLDDFVGALDATSRRSGKEYDVLRAAKRSRPSGEAQSELAASLETKGGKVRTAYKKKGAFSRKLSQADRGGKGRKRK